MSNRNKSKKKDEILTYICNPALNKGCPSRFNEGWCGVECFCTRSKTFAANPLEPLTYEQFEYEYDRRHQEVMV